MLQTIRSSNPTSGLFSALRVLALLCAVLVAGTQPALADPLDGPRAEGIVGERYDGYAELRVNNAPASVAALVRSINRQRGDYYKQIASKENVSLKEVGKLYANKIYQAAPRGYWFLTQDGQWKRKF